MHLEPVKPAQGSGRAASNLVKIGVAHGCEIGARMSYRSISALASVAVLAVLAAGCGGASEAEYRVPSLEVGKLKPCEPGLPKPEGFRCGSIAVPFERQDDSLGKTTIGFAVRPRDDRDKPSRGAIFAAEGGPGYSGSGSVRSYTHLFRGLLKRRELVVVDQRGTGLSEPIDCPDLQQGRAPEHIIAPECARRLGERATSYRTAAMADDIDDVRRALGYDEVTLYGDSYGSYLAQSYAYRHGDRLNALVLDSTYPIEGESPWYPSIPRTAIRSIDIACERSDECPGDAGKRLERLAQHMRDTGRGTGNLIDAIWDAGSGPKAENYYLDVDEAGRELLAGNPKPWRKLAGEEVELASHHPRFYRRATEVAVSCNDYAMFWDKQAPEDERREQLMQAIREHDRDSFEPFTPREIAISSELYYLYCLTWPPPGDLYEPPKPEGAEAPDVPTLVVAGELDSVTTPREGRMVAMDFPNSRYYEDRNSGHIAALYGSQQAAAKEIRSFLRRNIGN
jgi:pimeloyl-ACP methyl ester carboxylesterase